MVDFMLSKMKDYIDVIIPRGGKNLVKRVQEFSSDTYHWSPRRLMSYFY